MGAFLFGAGMQLGGACASGTLFAVGSGQSAIAVTLVGFIAGSVVYSAAWPLVADLPALPPYLLSDHVGWGGSWAITIALLAVLVVGSRAVQNRRVPAGERAALGPGRAARGPRELAGPVLRDKNSLTNIGIILGAAVAAGAAGTWRLHAGMNWKLVAAGLTGGVLMGVGARLAGGCNIGAYLAGIGSGSLHGWLWAVFALAGTWAGLRARALFGLVVPRPGDSVC